MASQLDIVNLALTRLGEARISQAELTLALAGTGTLKSSRSAAAVWSLVRDEVLAKHSWNRCVQRADLRRVTDAAKIVSGISAASPAVVTTTTPHGYVTGDDVILEGVRGFVDADGSLVNGVTFSVTVVSATTFSIVVDGTAATTAYTANGLSRRIRTRRLAETVTITGITAANPPVVTAAGHGYENGDVVYLAGIVGMTEPNGRYFMVGVTASTTFALANEVTAAAIDASAYTAYSSAGTAQKVVGAFTDWDYQYALPSDCLRVLDPSDDHDGAEFQIEAGGILVSDQGPTFGVRYIQKITDVTTFEPLLVNAFAARLAAEMAHDLTDNVSKQQAAIAAYQGFLSEARQTDAREQTPVPYEWDTWITERI